MRYKRRNPDIWVWVHIKICKNRSTYYIANAAILKGIAAFFYSTDFYVSADIPVYYNGVLSFRAADFIKSRAFLFLKIVDKPFGSRPRCRSPPSKFQLLPKTNFEILEEKNE